MATSDWMGGGKLRRHQRRHHNLALLGSRRLGTNALWELGNTLIRKPNQVCNSQITNQSGHWKITSAISVSRKASLIQACITACMTFFQAEGYSISSVWSYRHRRTRLEWHRIQGHSINPSGCSDTYFISQIAFLIVNNVWIHTVTQYRTNWLQWQFLAVLEGVTVSKYICISFILCQHWCWKMKMDLSKIQPRFEGCCTWHQMREPSLKVGRFPVVVVVIWTVSLKEAHFWKTSLSVKRVNWKVSENRRKREWQTRAADGQRSCWSAPSLLLFNEPITCHPSRGFQQDFSKHFHIQTMRYVDAGIEVAQKCSVNGAHSGSVIMWFNLDLRIESWNHSAFAPILTEHFCATSISGIDLQDFRFLKSYGSDKKLISMVHFGAFPGAVGENEVVAVADFPDDSMMKHKTGF